MSADLSRTPEAVSTVVNTTPIDLVSEDMSARNLEVVSNTKTTTNGQAAKRAVVVKTEIIDSISDTDGEEEEVEGVPEGKDGEYLADFPDDTDSLDLIHVQLSSLSNLGLTRFAPTLQRLCLRQNFISSLDPEIFCELTELEELDLYDNKVKSVDDALNKLSKLQVLDLSFNLIKAIPKSLASLVSLKTLYLIQNKVSKIEALEPLGRTLTSLELGGNKLRKLENLDALANLEELWVGKNKITKLENLGALKKLRILSIQSNRLTKIEGLEDLLSLQELYLSHNGLERIEGLENNLALRTLDLGANMVLALENISHLTSLEELWLNNNRIPDLRALEPQLRHIETLETIYLEGNPCQTQDSAGYRRKIILALPHLQQIDATYCKS